MEENLNRRVLEEGSVEARTIEEAIAMLRWGWAGSPGGAGGAEGLWEPLTSGEPGLAGQGALLFP